MTKKFSGRRRKEGEEVPPVLALDPFATVVSATCRLVKVTIYGGGLGPGLCLVYQKNSLKADHELGDSTALAESVEPTNPILSAHCASTNKTYTRRERKKQQDGEIDDFRSILGRRVKGQGESAAVPLQVPQTAAAKFEIAAECRRHVTHSVTLPQVDAEGVQQRAKVYKCYSLASQLFNSLVATKLSELVGGNLFQLPVTR
ncbi:hypothetical protein FB451DRAFT_1173224 [Mycena latifolia]|nr:hypothetical protein FB451DRAFT_1173224 [Mycena latifolia]